MFRKLVLVLSLYCCNCLAVGTTYLSEDVDDAITRQAMEDPDLFEGDIVLDSNQRFGHPGKARLWPNKTVIYQIPSNIPSSLERTIKAAMKHISEKTCIRFKEWSNEQSYIRFVRGKGCSSNVGKMRKVQYLSLGNGCGFIHIVVHELMHAIGFWHQHSRSDRDEYLNIHWENIKPRSRGNFFKLRTNALIFTPFDYESIMLYGRFAFSRNGSATMSAKMPGVVLRSASGKKLSEYDILSINKLYACV